MIEVGNFEGIDLVRSELNHSFHSYSLMNSTLIENESKDIPVY